MSSLPPYEKSKLVELVKEKALQFGDFTLASGKKSNFYIDCRNVTLSAEGAVLIAQGILSVLDETKESYAAVGGLTLGADPILAAVLTLAGIRQQPLKGFIVRKEAKGHGAGKLVEGPIKAGDKLVVVEDVSTTGGSALKAVEAVRELDCEVVRVVTVLDRLSGAEEAFAEAKVPFSSLLTLRDLGL